MGENLFSFSRRSLLKGAASSVGMGLSGCQVDPLSTAKFTPSKYADRPAMMAIGDSLYQGVRSLTFAPGMAVGSPPAQVAQVLDMPFTIPDPPQHILFDFESIYRSPSPLITAPIDLPRQLLSNSWQWRLRSDWSAHEAFDNVAIGSAAIDSLYTDNYDFHWERFLRRASQPQVYLFPFSNISEMWYSLNVCFTLNPRHRDEQRKTTQLCQVHDRKPRLLLVNIGSNEGLFSAAFQGDLEAGATKLKASLSKMEELARRLADLPKDVETIAFNSLIRPRAATNLMPADARTKDYPGDDYFDAYGPWLFSDQQPILRRNMIDFDNMVRDQNESVRSLMAHHLGSRLVFVDLYAQTTAFDGKHYKNRVLPIRGKALKNLPLSGTRSDMGGGLTGLDNMHPTIPGYSIIADAVVAALGKSAQTNKEAAFAKDSLLNNMPRLLAHRHQEVLALVRTIKGIGGGGLST